jgi:hypothetical protein
MDQLLREILVYFVAQTADQDIDHIGLWIKVKIPDLFHDHRLGNRTAPVAQHVIEQGEFLGL